MTLFYIIKNVNEPKLHFFSKYNNSFSSSYYYFLNRDKNYLKKNYFNLTYYSSIIQPYVLLDKINPITKKKTKQKNYFLYYELMNIFLLHKIKFTDNLKVNIYNSFSSSPILPSIFDNYPIIPFSFLTFTQNIFCVKHFIQKQLPNSLHTICYNIFCKKKIISLLKTSFQKKFDILIFELSNKDYKKNLSFCLMTILYFVLFHQNQTNQSMFILKIRNLTPLLNEFIYILSFIFESCYIVKSSIYNKYKNEKYLICKKLNKNVELFQIYQQKIKKNIIKKNIITSFLYNSLPIYFMNHMNEINNLMGQEQLLFLEHFIHFFQSSHLQKEIKLLKINQKEKCNSFLQLL